MISKIQGSGEEDLIYGIDTAHNSEHTHRYSCISRPNFRANSPGLILSPVVMTRTLLTGGSGFIASHILDTLLKRGHSVVTTVRSQEKAEQIKTSYPAVSKENLDFVIVPDVSAPDGSYLFIFSY